MSLITKVTDNRIVIGPVRLCYTHLLHKWSTERRCVDDNDGKYMTNVLIPKSETEALKALQTAVNEAARRGMETKWGGRKPSNLRMPVSDGDAKENDPEGIFADHYYLNPKSARRVAVLDRKKQLIDNEDEVYSGMWAYVSISFFPYSQSGGNGIGAGLESVLKYKDGDRLGGSGTSGLNAFDGIDIEDDTPDHPADDFMIL